ncbi:Hypothetical predicted protein, partial [Marmota monax]
SEGTVPGFINPGSQDSTGFRRLSTGTLLPVFMLNAVTSVHVCTQTLSHGDYVLCNGSEQAGALESTGPSTQEARAPPRLHTTRLCA